MTFAELHCQERGGGAKSLTLVANLLWSTYLASCDSCDIWLWNLRKFQAWDKPGWLVTQMRHGSHTLVGALPCLTWLRSRAQPEKQNKTNKLTNKQKLPWSRRLEMERSPALPRKPVHARQGRRDITPLTEWEILPTQGYCGTGRQRVPPAAIMITMHSLACKEMCKT